MATWAGKQLDLNLNSASVSLGTARPKKGIPTTPIYSSSALLFMTEGKDVLVARWKNARKLLLYHFYRFSTFENAALLVYGDTKLADAEKSVQKLGITDTLHLAYHRSLENVFSKYKF